MPEEPRRRLGRGLAALIGDAAPPAAAPPAASGRGARKVPVEFIHANPGNPRTAFEETGLAELAGSIREKGVIQPLLVRAHTEKPQHFQIIAGERRWRAAQLAGLHEVPVVIIEAGDRDVLELAIIENVQRADLNPVEEAEGYQRLASEFGYDQAALARVIGKSRSHVTNTLRLARLPDPVKKHLADGSLTAGHARALLTMADPEAVARRIIAQGLSVRDVERLAQAQAQGKTPAKTSAKTRAQAPSKSADTRALEKSLSDALGLQVKIAEQAEAGTLSIAYLSLEQLDRLCHLLRSSA